ncbi:MAG TPA: malate dehydrogenase [Thermotogae bacterium]|nr:malate dehydrogenase [Thermotogota bacterium]
MDYGEESLKLHRSLAGKISVVPKGKVNYDNLSLYYTPGVAAVSKRIAEQPYEVFNLTWRGNTVAVISDGTRVLGLGNVGPEAALPVMEGKALLFKVFGGVDAVPLVVRSKSEDELVDFCRAVAPTFGGINLEDIESPKCFYVLERLRDILDIPVWHDDQQGTATVILAGLLGALELTGRDLKNSRIVLVGMGAANTAVFRLLLKAGVSPSNILAVDEKGILSPQRLEEFEERDPRRAVCKLTNREGKTGHIPQALEDADVCIALSRPGPGVIEPSWIRKMSASPIVFACANPVPEILPEETLNAGAAVVATGRSDFPNQLNNVLVFPAMFRGVLDVRAKKITDGMCLAAANALYSYARTKGLSTGYIIPRLDEFEALIEEAVAVALEAVREGVARNNNNEEAIRKIIKDNILRSQGVLGKIV